MYLLLQGWRPDAYLPHPCSDTQNLAWVEGYHVQVWGEVLLIIKNNKYMYIIPCMLFQNYEKYSILVKTEKTNLQVY